MPKVLNARQAGTKPAADRIRHLAHHDDLTEALRDGELWNLWYTSIPAPQQLQAEIERRFGMHGA